MKYSGRAFVPSPVNTQKIKTVSALFKRNMNEKRT
jgi:hypothetical protein